MQTLRPLRDYADQLHGEIILADGGSEDDTIPLAAPFCDKQLLGRPGRALQMNQAAAQAQGEWLLFLHADSQLPTDFVALWQRKVVAQGRGWGRFDVSLSGEHLLLRLVERMMNLRSRLTSIATGDQAIFVKRQLFEALGGFAPIPLMEDIELCKRLRRTGRPLCLPSKLKTSSRHWEQRGVVRTILLMWKLRLLFFIGVSPQRLVSQYYRPACYQRDAL